MSPRTPQFDKIEKALLAKKLSANKRQYIPIQQFCEGRLKLFMTQMPPVGDVHDWSSICAHLKPGFVCQLLADLDFDRLADAREARCTLPELILLCEWFLDDYLGPYFRSLYEPPRSNTHSKSSETPGNQENPQKNSDQRPDFRAPLEETLEMAPDYEKILEDLKASAQGWKWGNSPFNWFKHIEIQAHRSIRAFVKAKIPCGSCNYYRHLDGRCIFKSIRKRQTSRGCSIYKPISVDSENLVCPDNLTVFDKITWRIISLLARAAEDANGKPRQAKKLERLHLTVLGWQEEGIAENETRIRTAQRHQVSSKTIDRDKKDLIKLLTKFRKNDPELKKLFVELEIADQMFLYVPENFGRSKS